MVISGSARSRWIAVAVMTATFLAGVMVGFAVPRLLAQPQQAEQAEPRDERGGRRERTSIFDRLDLTAEQQARRDSILEKRRRDMDAFWREHGPEMRAIVDSTRAEIGRLLTPEQRARLEEFREQRRRRDHPGSERHDERSPADRDGYRSYR